jgi:hypothetical protein
LGDFFLDTTQAELVHGAHAAIGVGVNVGDAYASIPRGVGELLTN